MSRQWNPQDPGTSFLVKVLAIIGAAVIMGLVLFVLLPLIGVVVGTILGAVLFLVGFILVGVVILVPILLMGGITWKAFFDRHAVEGSGVIAEDVRSVASFSGIDISGFCEVDVTAGQLTDTVTVRGDDNLLSLVQTTVESGVLRIRNDNHIRPKAGLRIVVSTTGIDALAISGAVKATVREIDESVFRLKSSGASKIFLSGRTDSFELRGDGASRIDAGQLVSDNVSVTSSGAGKAIVHATKKLDVKISGAWKVVFHGSPPVINRAVSGAGKIKPA